MDGFDRADGQQFEADPGAPGKPFSIVIPPPNVTGSLHVGHALNNTLQDVLVRMKRMDGFNTLWIPGMDHAGIATQVVVERQLADEGKTRDELGRDLFIARVWQWKEESGGTILRQLRRLGASCDWSRERFTLGPGLSRAVREVFVRLHEEGLIYRGKRLVNWDPVLHTAISDLEVVHEDKDDTLTYACYPFTDGSGHITIATTRPETMLADVAVAVHPSDERYKGLAGKTLRLPLLNREIPLIVDFYPDPEFGSGAVKITPAHDANDFQVGQRHNLPMPVLLDESAKVTEEGGPYAGLDRYEARKRIVADLEEGGFLERVDDHDIPILVSERSGEPIEPLLSEQWFADQAQLAEPVIAALKARKIKITPQRYERILLEWLENVHEWCISRQLWWGHRIPLYYAEDGTIVAAQSWAEAEKKAGKTIVRQDDDVLDTWFSSGLWPFAVLGWPQERKDLDAHYPTSLLVTARDIINLWVARMAMMGLDFTQDVPFHQVYIYATVQTEDGKRMSKSLGTGVDPMTIIDTKGADALRYTLISQCGENQDIRYSERRTDDARNLCNKIWNATRFSLDIIGERAEGIDRESRNEFLCLTDATVTGGHDVSAEAIFVHAIGLKAPDAALMRDAARQAGITHQVGLVMRFSPVAWMTRELIRVRSVRSRLLGDATPDTGCGLKLLLRPAFLELPQFDHMHRFLPALVQRNGGATLSVEVGHRSRTRGRSNYGVLDRLWVGIVDLAGVLWLQRRARRPQVRELPRLPPA